MKKQIPSEILSVVNKLAFNAHYEKKHYSDEEVIYMISSDPMCPKCSTCHMDFLGKNQEVILRCEKCKFQSIKGPMPTANLVVGGITTVFVGNPLLVKHPKFMSSVQIIETRNNLRETIEQRFGPDAYSTSYHHSQTLNCEIFTDIPPLSARMENQILKNRLNQEYLPIKISKSRIQGAGMGVFASEKLPKSRIVVSYIGQCIRVQQYWPSSDSLYSLGWIKENTQWSLIGVEPIKKLNVGRFINSDVKQKCNCAIGKALVNGEVSLYIYTLREIEEQQQLFYYYGDTFSTNSGFDPKEGNSVPYQSGHFSRLIQSDDKSNLKNYQIFEESPQKELKIQSTGQLNALRAIIKGFSSTQCRKKGRSKSRKFITQKIEKINQILFQKFNHSLASLNENVRNVLKIEPYDMWNPLAITNLLRYSIMHSGQYTPNNGPFLSQKSNEYFTDTHFTKVFRGKTKNIFLKHLRKFLSLLPPNVWQSFKIKEKHKNSLTLLKAIFVCKSKLICSKSSDWIKLFSSIPPQMYGFELLFQITIRMHRAFSQLSQKKNEQYVYQFFGIPYCYESKSTDMNLFDILCRNKLKHGYFVHVDYIQLATKLRNITVDFRNQISDEITKFFQGDLKNSLEEKISLVGYLQQKNHLQTGKYFESPQYSQLLQESVQEQVDKFYDKEEVDPIISSEKIQKSLEVGTLMIEEVPNQLKNKKTLTKQQLAITYRQFSRQKYNKYRHQFPRMRQSQLVCKIIKQWEGLSAQEKENQYDHFISERAFERAEYEQSSENVQQYDSSENVQQKQVSKKKIRAGENYSGVRVFVRDVQEKTLPKRTDLPFQKIVKSTRVFCREQQQQRIEQIQKKEQTKFQQMQIEEPIQLNLDMQNQFENYQVKRNENNMKPYQRKMKKVREQRKALKKIDIKSRKIEIFTAIAESLLNELKISLHSNENLYFEYKTAQLDPSYDFGKKIAFINQSFEVKSKNSQQNVFKRHCIACGDSINVSIEERHMKNDHHQIYWKQYMLSNMLHKTLFVFTMSKQEVKKPLHGTIIFCTPDHDVKKKWLRRLTIQLPQHKVQCWRFVKGLFNDVTDQKNIIIDLTTQKDNTNEQTDAFYPIKFNPHSKITDFVFNIQSLHPDLQESYRKKERISAKETVKHLFRIGINAQKLVGISSIRYNQRGILYYEQKDVTCLAFVLANKIVTFGFDQSYWPRKNMIRSKFSRLCHEWEQGYHTIFWAQCLMKKGRSAWTQLEFPHFLALRDNKKRQKQQKIAAKEREMEKLKDELKKIKEEKQKQSLKLQEEKNQLLKQWK